MHIDFDTNAAVQVIDSITASNIIDGTVEVIKGGKRASMTTSVVQKERNHHVPLKL